MCGIAGMVGRANQPVQSDVVRAMCSVMAHRGPDDDGFYIHGNVGLGMRRLSIIDLATGQQPISNEDGSIWIVFNGEIYNFSELRRDLEARGHRFQTATDTEAIVHLYEEYGPRCVEKLRGMFAFAIWDNRRHELLLARDRLGIKPLYYAEKNGWFVFASELKAILEVPEVERKLNWGAVSHLFTFLTTPSAESIVEGVRKLEPANILVVAPGQAPRTERYWDVHFAPDYGRPEAFFVERLQALLEESTRLHLMSDVPLGVFLSGGIDSSAVLAMMARHHCGPVKTFSIGFADQDYSELAYARLVADAFGTDHHELVLEPDVTGILRDLAWHLDEPFGDSSAIPTYMVSRLASQYVTVVLSGDGGDEIFAGYDKYVVEGKERRVGSIPTSARRALHALAARMPAGLPGQNLLWHLSLPDSQRYVDACTLFSKAQQRKLFQRDVLELMAASDPWTAAAASLARANGHWLSALQYNDLHAYLPEDILTKVDRMSMAHSIEARPPLLDHKLVEFAATIPADLKLHNGTTKYIFKRALHGILPPAILTRSKRGFAIPLGRWFRGRLREFVRDLLISKTSRARDIFNLEHIETLLSRSERGREGDLDLELWTLISFELWCETFLDRDWKHSVDAHSQVRAAAAGRAGGATPIAAQVNPRP